MKETTFQLELAEVAVEKARFKTIDRCFRAYRDEITGHPLPNRSTRSKHAIEAEGVKLDTQKLKLQQYGRSRILELKETEQDLVHDDPKGPKGRRSSERCIGKASRYHPLDGCSS